MKTYTLTRAEAGKMQRDQSGIGERIAAERYGFNRKGTPYYDIGRSTGAVAEVKSTLTRLTSGRHGRFRLWKEQHDRLTAHNRDGSAWYVFVLFDVSENPPVAYLKRKDPADIGRMVGSRGGFNRSGHEKGRQKKLPWTALYGLQA